MLDKMLTEEGMSGLVTFAAYRAGSAPANVRMSKGHFILGDTREVYRPLRIM